MRPCTPASCWTPRELPWCAAPPDPLAAAWQLVCPATMTSGMPCNHTASGSTRIMGAGHH